MEDKDNNTHKERYEELVKAKKDLLKEWLGYLKSDDEREEILWLTRSRAYYAKLLNIFEELESFGTNDLLERQKIEFKFIKLIDNFRKSVTKRVQIMVDLEEGKRDEEAEKRLNEIKENVKNGVIDNIVDSIKKLEPGTEFTIYDMISKQNIKVDKKDEEVYSVLIYSKIKDIVQGKDRELEKGETPFRSTLIRK